MGLHSSTQRKGQILTSGLFMQQDYHSLVYSTNIKAKWEEGVLDYWTESLGTDHLPGMKLHPSKKVIKTLLKQIANGNFIHQFQLRYCLMAGILKLFVQFFSAASDDTVVMPLSPSWYPIALALPIPTPQKFLPPFIVCFNKPGVSCFKVVLGW